VIRILVVDDHPMVRAGLGQLLSVFDGVELVATAAGGAEAVAVVARTPVDVVLMDLSMPGMDGIEATRRILAEQPEVRVVVLTSFSDRERILEALDAGAIGYLLKDADPDELLRGIRAAADGQSPLAPKAAHALLSARRQQRPASALTTRERAVLALVAQGLANKVIAQRLSISEKTVKAHLTRVFQTIGVSDRTGAALWARDHGIGRSYDQ
jgi:DNA-binding NarL/FixJ family response regulator